MNNKQNFENKNNKKNNPKQNFHNKQNTNFKHQNEINKLKQEISSLSENVKNLLIENNQLKQEIKKINDDYVQKITTKSLEAKKIIDEKQQALEERFNQDVKSKITNYIENKFSGLLDSINQLSLIVNSNVSSEEVKNYLFGFRMILELFDKSLSEMNITKINVNIGDVFDEKYMSAFEIVETSNVATNHVAAIISPAYKFEDKVIKYALVKVQK